MINFKKSQPSPECLALEKVKSNGNYSCGDVRIRLVQDFYNKCYLCEEKAPSSLNIEHFRPHKGNIDLKFDWNNLFLACSHCNNTKLAKAIYDHILDCTDSNNLITECIEFGINPFPLEQTIITARVAEGKVVNTVTLLQEIYQGKTINKQLEANNIRQKLILEIQNFQNLLIAFYYSEGLTTEEKQDIQVQIRRKLSSDSAFTAFKIWIIKRNTTFLNDFGRFINN